MQPGLAAQAALVAEPAGQRVAHQDETELVRGHAGVAQGLVGDLVGHGLRGHLVAGPADACAAVLERFADAGARHIVVMAAGSPALEHFVSLRRAFTGSHALAGTLS